MAGIQIDGVNNKIDFDDDQDTSISSNTDDTLVFEIAGATDFTMTANTFTAASGSTIAAQALTATTVTASGIVKTDDTTNATSTTDGSLQTDGGLSVVLDAVFGDDIKLKSDSAVINFGADDDITMTHVADTGLLINGASTPKLTIRTADGTSASIKLQREDENDVKTDFELKNDDGTFKIISDNSSINERAIVNFESAIVTFNEDSADIDFRVESNGNTHMLFVDGGNDHINIGGSSDLGGMFNVAGNGVFQNDDQTDTLSLVNTDADANVGPRLKFARNSASPAVNDYTGDIRFEGKDDAGNDFVAAQIRTQITGVTNGSEEGKFWIETMKAGTARQRISIAGAETILNEDSVDIDFRVESQSETHMLFVDAANDALCIGDSNLSPSTSSTATHAVFKNNGSKLEISASSNPALAVNRVNSEGTAVELRQAGGLRGSISVAGATAAFNTSSDYRLKENVSYDWDATTRLKQLKPARFNWISDDTNTLVDGFLAHEAKTVVPESVIGEKDAVDENGDVDPQQIDHSKLVPLLVKTIQELEARITTLEG
jgi:hypothetical protein